MFTEDDVIDALELIADQSRFLVPFCAHGHKHTDGHIAYHVASGLAALTQAVPDALKLNMMSGMPNLYVCLVGDAGESRKSTSIKFATEALTVKVLGNDDRFSERHLPSEPGSDVALVDSLVQRKQQLVVYKEFGAFLASSAGETGNNPMARVRTKLIEAYDQGKMSNVTRGRGNKEVDDVRLSLLAGAAPEFFTQYTTAIDWKTGFMSRFLFIYPYVKERAQEEVIVDPRMQADIALRWRHLARSKEASKKLGWEPIPQLSIPGPVGVLENTGILQWMTEDAAAAYTDWVDREIDTRKAKKDPLLSATVARAYAIVKKVAMLVAWDTGTAWTKERWRLGEAEIRFACAVAGWAIESAERLSAVIGDTRESREINLVLQGVPEDGTPVSLPKLLTLSQMHFRRFEGVVQTLVKRGIVKTCVVPNDSILDAMSLEEHTRVTASGPVPMTTGYRRVLKRSL